MPDDVYQPPASGLTVAEDRSLREPQDFDIALALSDGWSAMVSNFPLWLGIGIVGYGLVMLSGLTIVGLPLLVPIFVWGGVLALLNMFDGRGDFTDLFAGFSDYWPRVLRMLCFLVHITLLTLVGSSIQLIGQLSEDVTLTGIGVLFTYVWSFGVMIRLNLAYFFAVEHEMGPIEAFVASWKYTRGQWLRLVLVMIVMIAIGIGGFIALFIGLIPATAINAFMYVSVYRQITGTRIATA